MYRRTWLSFQGTVRDSKKDLIEIVERFQLFEIVEYASLKKKALGLEVWRVLEARDQITADNEYFFVSSLEELKEYLKNVSGKQITSNSVKFDVVDRVKNLQYYTKGGYEFAGTNYKSIDDVVVDAEFVRHFGDLPAVRRVIDSLNGDPKMPLSLKVVMTRRIEQRVNKVVEIRKNNYPRYHVKYGPVTIDFS